MSLDGYPERSTTADAIVHRVKIVGAATATCSKVADTGPGITVTYISTGVVDLTWGDNPGLHAMPSVLFQATTPGDVKLFVCVTSPFNATTNVLRLNFYESGTLADLNVLEWAAVTVAFKKSGTGV